MGLFDLFRKKADAAPKGRPPQDLPNISYGMAYFMLPPLLYQDPARIRGYFENAEIPAGSFLYVMYCKAQGIEPLRADAALFRSHTGVLREGTTYYVIEYPPSPPADLGRPGATLAPLFSAILWTEATGGVAYYILGQRPFGGTTLRTVTPEGTNANLGEGPPPELDAFLDSLRQMRQ